MSHYKTDATRAEATDPKWLPVGRQVGELANEWSKRSDIVAYVGPGAGGPAPACFVPASAEVEVNVDVAFGFGVEPEDIDLRSRSGRYEFPKATGAIMHEAFHARFSRWDMKDAKDALDDAEFQALMLLEESRIEYQGILHMPKAKAFLESCALEIVIADAAEQFGSMSDTKGASTLVALVYGRVDAGILHLDDVREVTNLLDDFLGLDVVAKLREIATKAQEHDNHWDSVPLRVLAQEWVRILRDVAKEKGEDYDEAASGMAGMPGGEGDEGEGAGMSEIMSALADALNESAENVEISNGSSLDDAETAEKYQEVTKEKAEKAKERKDAKDMAAKTFSSGTGPLMGAATHSTLSESRPPRADERVAANVIATKLEKAKYRDRDVTEISSVLPPGRLRSRAAVQGAALRERGVMQQAEAWKRKVRKHTDEPTLNVGVLVDISGSMGSAMEPMATTAYVMSEAVQRVQGKAAMVYYGNDVFPTLRPGERMSEVKVYNAPDGTEKFDDAFRALDGAMDLLSGQGARLLVVVSDGHYTTEETRKCQRWMRRCAEEGVAVVWLPFDDGYMAKHQAGEYGVVLSGRFDPTEAASKIGQACERAINETTARKVS